MNVDAIRSQLQNAEERFEHAKADMAASFETNPAYAIVWKAGSVLLAQARYEIAMHISVDDFGEDDASLEAELNDWAKAQLSRLDGLVRTDSKSTSAMSNVESDAKAQATLELLEMILGR